MSSTRSDSSHRPWSFSETAWIQRASAAYGHPRACPRPGPGRWLARRSRRPRRTRRGRGGGGPAGAGPELGVGGARLRGLVDRGAQGLDDGLGRDAVALEADQGGADVAGQARHVEPLGQGERGHRDLAALVVPSGPAEHAGVDRQHLRPGVGRLVGDERDGLAGERERVVLGLGHRQRAGEHAEELAAHRVVGVGRQVVELLAGDPERAGRVAGRDQGVGDEADQPRAGRGRCRRAAGCRATGRAPGGSAARPPRRRPRRGRRRRRAGSR